MELRQILPDQAQGTSRTQAGSSAASRAALADTAMAGTQKDLLSWFRHAPVRMPRTRPELFQLLALHNPHLGWEAFLGLIDFSGVTPREIYQVVLGRYPETAEQALMAPGYDAKEHFREALLSREFRSRILGIFLQAFQSKGRDVFIHIPKCAGTDLILNLGRRSVPLPKMLEVEGWTNGVEFLEIIGGLARAAMTSERLFVYGHMELGAYADIAGIRPGDHVFTVLRDPIDLKVSQANYAVGRLRQDPTGKEPDAAEYLGLLGLTQLPEPMSNADLKDLTIKALLNPRISEPNPACFYLGRESRAVYAIALENLIIHNVEVTTTRHYDRWLKERWAIEESARHNRSEPILTNAEARRLCGGALKAATREDQKLYDVVSWALQQTGGASINGHDLARLIGPALGEALHLNERPPLAAVARETSTEQKLLVAEDVKDVEMYLTPVSVTAPGTAKMETVVATGFGAKAGGDAYLVEGWARSELEFTWTADAEATIRLPCLRGEGRFIVRLVANPFVVRQRLPFQMVELLMGDIRIGSCTVRHMSVIEADVPRELVDGEKPITVTLRLPTAARPCELTESKDDRLLALAVRSLTVFHVRPAGG
jgi:hypothetical protein